MREAGVVAAAHDHVPRAGREQRGDTLEDGRAIFGAAVQGDERDLRRQQRQCRQVTLGRQIEAAARSARPHEQPGNGRAAAAEATDEAGGAETARSHRVPPR